MAPFPLCCLTGLISADAAATAAAFFTGLTAGGAVTTLSQVAPKYGDAAAPLAELLADHKQRATHSRTVQRRLVAGGLVAAAAAAGINSSKEAAVPLALSAALSTASIALTVLVVYPINSRLSEAGAALPPAGSPAKQGKGPSPAQEAGTRADLARYVSASTARTVIASLAFGSALCGVLLLNKKG